MYLRFYIKSHIYFFKGGIAWSTQNAVVLLWGTFGKVIETGVYRRGDGELIEWASKFC